MAGKRSSTSKIKTFREKDNIHDDAINRTGIETTYDSLVGNHP